MDSGLEGLRFKEGLKDALEVIGFLREEFSLGAYPPCTRTPPPPPPLRTP